MTDWLAAADRVAAVAAAARRRGRAAAPAADGGGRCAARRRRAADVRAAVYGGPEVDPPTILQVIERIAAADGAAGWCTMIATTTSLLSHYVRARSRPRRSGATRATFTGGVFARNAQAVKVDGGYRVTGRVDVGQRHAALPLDHRRRHRRRLQRLDVVHARPGDVPRHVAHVGPARHRVSTSSRRRRVRARRPGHAAAGHRRRRSTRRSARSPT